MCSSLAEAEKELGPGDAVALRSLLADLEAADNATDFLELAGDDATIEEDRIRMRVGAKTDASFVVVGLDHKVLSAGRPDWSTVLRLKLTDVAACP